MDEIIRQLMGPAYNGRTSKPRTDTIEPIIDPHRDFFESQTGETFDTPAPFSDMDPPPFNDGDDSSLGFVNTPFNDRDGHVIDSGRGPADLDLYAPYIPQIQNLFSGRSPTARPRTTTGR